MVLQDVEGSKAGLRAAILRIEDQDNHSALDVLGSLISRNPTEPAAYFYQGVAYSNLGFYKRALESYKTAESLGMDSEKVVPNIALCLAHCRHFEEARNMIESSPSETVGSKIAIAYIYTLCGDVAEPKNLLDQLVSDENPSKAQQIEIAKVYRNIYQYREAIELLKTCYEANPKDKLILSELLKTFLSSNIESDQLDFIKNLAGPDILQLPVDGKLAVLAMYTRFKKFTEFVILAKSIDVELLTLRQKTEYFKYVGDHFDSRNLMEKAIVSYQYMNFLIEKEVKTSSHLDKRRKIKFLDTMLSGISLYKIEKTNIQDLEPLGFNLSFIVGMPRSGTTLLERILRSHSEIDIVDEVDLVGTLFKRAEIYDYKVINELTVAQINKLRKHYINEVGNYTHGKANVVDKMPMNASFLPFIARVFPESKIIYSLRQPLDTALSNWMAHFRLNDSMANMQKFEDIFELFDRVSCLIRDSSVFFGNNYCEIRYEDLTQQPASSVARLLKFLDVEEEDLLSKYRNYRSGRSIKTPSYNAISKPITSASINKAHRYMRLFERDLDKWNELSKRSGYKSILKKG